MHRLNKICTTPKHLLVSQFLFLDDKLKEKEGSLTFIHKYLIKINIKDSVYYIKVNLVDNEFYLFSKKDKMSFFRSFYELRDWILTQLIEGEKCGESL